MPYMSFISKGLRIQGSAIADRKSLVRMLEFATEHKIHPIVETFPMSVEGINEAFTKLRKGTMRFRGVLVVS